MNEAANEFSVSCFSRLKSDTALHEELDALLRSSYGGDGMKDAGVRLLRQHKKRCTFEMRINTETSTQDIICKFYLNDRAEIFRNMQLLLQNGFWPEGTLAIPRPLHYAERFHMLVYEKAVGEGAVDVLVNSEPDRMAEIGACTAAWLSKFHESMRAEGKLQTMDEFISSLTRKTERLASACPPLSENAKLLLDAIEAALPSGWMTDVRAGHGSYIIQNILLDGHRTVVVDLDDLCLSDRARDVAWFVISIQSLGIQSVGTLGAYGRATSSFLDKYAELSGEDALLNLPLQCAVEYLRRAVRDVCKRMPPDYYRAGVFLKEGLAALQDSRGGGRN